MKSQITQLNKLFSRLIILVAIGFAVYLLLQDNALSELTKLRINIYSLLGSFLISYFGIFIGAIPAWRKIIQQQGIRQTYWNDAKIYCYSALGTVLPGRIWTIAGRASFYQQHGFSSIVVTISSILENTIIGIAAFLIYIIATIIQPQIGIWAEYPIIGILIILACLPLIHPAVFQRMMNSILRRMKKETPPENRYTSSQLIQWFTIEVVVTIVGGISIYALLDSIRPTTTEFLLPIIAAWAAGVAVGNLFFWLPGTPIFRDGAMFVALTPYTSSTQALIFVAYVRIWAIVSLLSLAGLVYLITYFLEKFRK